MQHQRSKRCRTLLAALLLLPAISSYADADGLQTVEKVYNDGSDGHLLRAGDIDEDAFAYVRVEGAGTTLTVTSDVTIKAGGSDANVGMAAVNVLDGSELRLAGRDILVRGSGYSSSNGEANGSDGINNDGGGGAAIEILSGSRAVFQGPVTIVGGSGSDATSDRGTGGDGLRVFDANSSVEIEGATVAGGAGSRPGRALVVEREAAAMVQSGIIDGRVYVASGGRLDAYGAAFMQQVDATGGGSVLTFHGCFVQLPIPGWEGMWVVHGDFVNSDATEETTTITVNVTEGAQMVVGTDCSNTAAVDAAAVPDTAAPEKSPSGSPTTEPTYSNDDDDDDDEVESLSENSGTTVGKDQLLSFSLGSGLLVYMLRR